MRYDINVNRSGAVYSVQARDDDGTPLNPPWRPMNYTLVADWIRMFEHDGIDIGPIHVDGNTDGAE